MTMKKLISFILIIALTFSFATSISFAEVIENVFFQSTLGVRATSNGTLIPIQKNVEDKWIVSVPSGTSKIYLSNISECDYIANEAFTEEGEDSFAIVVNKEFAETNDFEYTGPDENGEFATVYKGNIIKNLIMDCQSYTKYRPNETTGGIFVSWRRKEELPTGA